MASIKGKGKILSCLFFYQPAGHSVSIWRFWIVEKLIDIETDSLITIDSYHAAHPKRIGGSNTSGHLVQLFELQCHKSNESISLSLKQIMNSNQLTISAPGRICLFGEHLDYLGLSVITAAINLRISIQGQKRQDRLLHIDLPDIRGQEIINLAQPIHYEKERDYLRSSVNVLLRQQVNFPCGYNCVVRGRIPINSGTSSSSALVVAWIKFLLTIAGDSRGDDPLAIARLAHQAEVLEFGEPGGMMDHFAASFGSILYIDFSSPGGRQQPLPARLGKFVLGDSREPKDTKGILARVKGGILDAMQKLSRQNPKLTIKTLSRAELAEYKNFISPEQYELCAAAIANREITEQAKMIFEQNQIDDETLGRLLNLQQQELRERLRISTARIDRMIDAALAAGALGAKINGSGGGGCMFAYAPELYEPVAAAIARAGGKPYIIEVDQGVSIDAHENNPGSAIFEN